MKMGTAKKKRLVIFLFGVFLLSLVGCSSDSSSSYSELPQEPADASAAWGTAEVIGSNVSPDNDREPQIAITDNGNAVAVWVGSDGNLWANDFDASLSKWSTAELIGTDNPLGAVFPRVAMDRNGKAIAVWQKTEAGKGNLWANYFVPGSGWGMAEPIDFNDGYSQDPDIAFDPFGNAIVVFSQDGNADPAHNGIYANRFDVSNLQWDGAQLINFVLDSASSPQISIDSDGNAIAVWQQGPVYKNSIWANRLDANSLIWLPEEAETIEFDDTEANFPQIGMDASNNAIAVWQQYDGSDYSIRANRFNATTLEWGLPVWAGNDTLPGWDTLRLSVDHSGNAIAVWYKENPPAPGTYGVWTNRFEASASEWEQAEPIDTRGGSAEIPQIAMDADGNAFAIWRQYAEDLYTIESIRFDASSLTWNTPEQIQSDDLGIYVKDPQIAMNAAGNAIAIWRQEEFNRTWSIWVNQFN